MVLNAQQNASVDPETGFAVNYLKSAEWEGGGLRSFLRYRDLGIAAATNGRLKRAAH